MKLVINTDGASRSNPGPASYGFVIRVKDGEILHQEGGAIGVNTNNVAEYTAVCKALEYVKDHYSHKAPHQIQVLLDSLLVASQLSGLYKLKNPNLKTFFDRIKSLEFDLGQVSYSHIRREQNFLADRLANQALDAL